MHQNCTREIQENAQLGKKGDPMENVLEIII